MDIQATIAQYSETAISYVPTIVMAVVMLIVGFWIVRQLTKLIDKGLQNADLDQSLSKFLSSIFSALLKLLVLLAVASQVGVPVTSFIAIISALMVGIGMALNGTIGHFASGVMLMIFKPFKVGDLVTIGGGQTGSVDEISAFSTVLRTLDNKKIIISNSNVIGNDITNISGQEIVGVELAYGIAYDASIDEARKVIMEVGKSCPHIIDSPAIGVVVGELGDSAVVLNTRPFCKSEHYWDTYFYMQEHVKKGLDKAGIGIPYNTMDVNILK